MNLLRLSLLFFSLNSFCGNTIFGDMLDEFTDERTLNLGVFADDSNSISPKVIGIFCNKGDRPRMVLKTGFMFSTKSTLIVTYRFDKNEPDKQVFTFESNANGSMLYTYNKLFIQRFLDDLRISDNLILRIEGSSEIVRFSDLTESETNVSKFVNAASEMAFDCPLF
jgi:hypothetical protein